MTPPVRLFPRLHNPFFLLAAFLCVQAKPLPRNYCSSQCHSLACFPVVSSIWRPTAMNSLLSSNMRRSDDVS
ncbi:hypothetical protein F5141DRAFT_1150211 [Pisolithus sp. B1]|nr:hypothetical protein F5141DRAFT_1150211 [Pisolithus sp. B1]